jgi:hypothetical protein
MDYLTTAEVAKRYRTAEATVRYWRMVKYGPRGARVGRKVLYPMSEIERFDAELLATAQASTDAEEAS